MQDHTPNVQTLGPPSPPEPESEAQESACLGGSQGTLTPVDTEGGHQPRGFQPSLMLGARMSSSGALGGRLSPVRPPARPTGSPSHRIVAVCTRWAGPLARMDGRVPCPGEIPESPARRDHHLQSCPLALQGSLPWPPLSVVHICWTSDAPDTGRASGSWGPWLGAPLMRLPGSAPCLGALADPGPPPPPFPSGRWVTVCMHRPPHTPTQMEREGQGMGPAGRKAAP